MARNVPLHLDRRAVLLFRRMNGHVERRLPPGAASLARAAAAGLADSMPRAALLSLAARVEGVEGAAWEHPALVQIWGPRHSVYLIAREDLGVFTLGLLPEARAGLGRARDYAARLAGHFAALPPGTRQPYGEVGKGLDLPPNALRYAAPTGTVLLRWDGARQPLLGMTPAPGLDPREARLELARRHLHACGPTRPAAFADWSGLPLATARATHAALSDELITVRTPLGEDVALARDEPALAAALDASHVDEGPARLLPSGDSYTLHQGAERALLVPDAARERELFTPRVWPGAVLQGGEIVGTWRRAGARVILKIWRSLGTEERAALAAEALALPLPGLAGRLEVRFEG